jgi:hypothetical protein
LTQVDTGLTQVLLIFEKPISYRNFNNLNILTQLTQDSSNKLLHEDKKENI